MMTGSWMEVLPPPPATEACFPSLSWFFVGGKRCGSGSWTREENKQFEYALAKYDGETPDRWERVAACVPGKTVGDVKRHYRRLLHDVEEIESGRMPRPWEENSRRRFDSPDQHGRKRGVPWSEEEHILFLRGLEKYGKGDWRNISRNFVITRTPTQVASHAQKYFIRRSSGGGEKRRPSIHDITVANLPDEKTQSLFQSATN